MVKNGDYGGRNIGEGKEEDGCMKELLEDEVFAK